MREAEMAIERSSGGGRGLPFSMSEFDINTAYLTATGTSRCRCFHTATLALNEHAAVLHYTKLDHQAPSVNAQFSCWMRARNTAQLRGGSDADTVGESDNDYAHLVKDDVNDEQLA